VYLNIIVFIRKCVNFVGLHCNDCIIIHGMENVKKNTFLMIQLFMIGITCTYCTAVENLMSYKAVLMHLTFRRYFQYNFPINKFTNSKLFLVFS
jgi:hypothetical protein